MVLTEFLTSRVAEDEDEARRAFGTNASDGTWLGWILEVCETRRRIIDLAIELGVDRPDCGQAQLRAGLDRVLRVIALQYVDHPDFEPEWR